MIIVNAAVPIPEQYDPKLLNAFGRYIQPSATLVNIVQQSFNMLSGICLVAYGLKEIILDSHPAWFRIVPNPQSSPLIQKIQHSIGFFIEMIRNKTNCLLDRIRYTAHGILMIATGVAGSLSALDRIGYVTLGSLLPACDFVAGGCFLVGSLIYLEFNIEKFISATKQLLDDNIADKTFPAMQLAAAAVGIVSNLAYIAASFTTMAAAPFAYPLVLGIAAVILGGIRILLESLIAYMNDKQLQPA